MAKPRGISYKMRVATVNRIYDRHSKSGLSNREIWKRFVYPVYGISESTFYSLLKASADLEEPAASPVIPSLFDSLDEQGSQDQKA